MAELPELGWRAVEEIAAAGGQAPSPASEAALERIEIELGYEGYLRRQEADAGKLQRADGVLVPGDLDYRGIPGLSNEVVEKLEAIRPRSVGQASRISGVTPADVGRFFDDDRPPNLNDPEILVLAIDDANRRRVATLVNWASHPEALGSKNTLLTADWPWALARDVEQEAGGIAVFVNTASRGHSCRATPSTWCAACSPARTCSVRPRACPRGSGAS